ncbi:tetratricopeptide repeat protein [Roseinatronobacter sp.]
MPRSVLVACLCLTVLAAACTPAPQNGAVDLGMGPDQMGPQASRSDIAEVVDGLIVGHRLMAAGEFELALRAYYRSMAEQGTSVDALSAIGSANLRLGRVQQAEQILRRALELDQRFVPAHNNLGVALAEQNRWGEAQLHFRNAFAFDSGHSREIRDNLRLAIEKTAETGYDDTEAHQLSLMRRGSGRFLLLSTPL